MVMRDVAVVKRNKLGREEVDKAMGRFFGVEGHG